MVELDYRSEMIRVFLCVLVFAMCCCFFVEAQELELYKPFYGKWKVDKLEGNIFEGSIHILTVKTRPGSRASEMLVIYDEQQRGFLCSQMNSEKKDLVCGVVKLNKKNVSSDDRADLITNQLAEMPYFILALKIKNNTLEITGYPLTNYKCVNEGNCSYKLLSVLVKAI